jgi:hypothetical protein
VTAVDSRFTVRVTVVDTWLPLTLEAAPTETVAALKARALAACRISAAHAGAYEVKHAGVLVRDETQSLSAAGIGDGAALVVLSRRRRPVR